MDGINVKELSLYELRESVAVVLQKNTLFSGTIAENLRWGNEEASDEALVQACRIAQADSFIRSFPDGYETQIGQGGGNLSGGQKQRICIARALNIPWLRSHPIRYREPPLPNDGATCI